MVKGCIDCRHYKGRDFFQETPARCLAGNTDVMNSWWEENGSKTRDQEVTDSSCFEPTENSVRLDALIAQTKQVLDVIKCA